MKSTNTNVIRTEETLAAVREIVSTAALMGWDEANAFRLIKEAIAAADKTSKQTA